MIFRPLVVECSDPNFLRAAGGHGSVYHALFLVLVVLNLVAGFQSLGTLMAVGLMVLPAVEAGHFERVSERAMRRADSSASSRQATR